MYIQGVEDVCVCSVCSKSMCLLAYVPDRVKRGQLDQQVRMESKVSWGCSGLRAPQDFQGTTGTRYAVCVPLCVSPGTYPCGLFMCRQGEQGEPGQKGSKGDKGEGVSLDLEKHIHYVRSVIVV